MFDLVSFLSTVLPIIAIVLLLAVLAVNFYFVLRRKFPISVNCWFCNTWTKVAYDRWNSFECPHCLQYNGFTEDGDYNKIIPQQHDELMNKERGVKNKKHNVTSNGLCMLCNNNQQLKIFQLANFVPMVEENYDKEIEHFREQLDKAYQLCKKCDKVLKTTLKEQNAWLFGNRVKDLKNRILSVDKIRNLKNTRKTVISKLVKFLSLLLVLKALILISTKFISVNYMEHVPEDYVNLFKNFATTVTASITVQNNLLAPHFVSNLKINPFITICGLGLFFQLIITMWNKVSSVVKTNQLFCWFILLLTSWVNYALHVFALQMFSVLYLLCAVFINDEEVNKSMKFKATDNLKTNGNGFLDSADFEDISTSSKKESSSSSSTSNYLNLTTYPNHCNNVPQHYAQSNTASNVFNNSFGHANNNFMTARSTVNNSQLNFDTDLHKSLDNLHLGTNLSFKSPSLRATPPVFSVTPVSVKRPKPVLSPPKLQPCNQNSWVAGGFWKTADGIILPVSQRTNLSRTSSESSGFSSQHNDNLGNKSSLFFNECDRASELNYFKSVSPTNFASNSLEGDKIYYRKSAIFTTLYPQTERSYFANHTVLSPRNGFTNSSVFSEPMIRENEPYQRKNMFRNWIENSTQNFQHQTFQPNLSYKF